MLWKYLQWEWYPTLSLGTIFKDDIRGVLLDFADGASKKKWKTCAHWYFEWELEGSICIRCGKCEKEGRRRFIGGDYN